MMYEVRDFKSWRDDGGGPEMMANFTAVITDEVRYVGGATPYTMLTIRGTMPADLEDDVHPRSPLAPPQASDEGTPLPPIEINAEEFGNLGWVLRNWGVRCIVAPIPGVKDDLRTMIQQMSRPRVKTVYQQTGWMKINGKQTYLHAGGGISRTGNDPAISVALPPELMRYNLATKVEPREAITASLDLLNVAAKEITWPLLAATLAPLYGPVDFAAHVTGRTGSFKSELMSLYQSHYGPTMDARNLPGSWSSTPNALEALAFFACNAAFTIDDFVPGGTTWQQRSYQANADKIIRAQGNQAGRARLTDTSNLQATMYPRGIILSTGEDTPEGHSVRARLLIMELAAGDIEAGALTKGQAARPLYCGTVAWLAQSLATEPDAYVMKRMEEIRTQQRGIGHSRTPGMLGRLIATAEDFLRRARVAGCITPAAEQALARDAAKAILATGAKQQTYLEDADPVDVFNGAVRQVLASGGGHLRQLNGGVPRMAEMLGWTAERSMGELASFKARGPCIGWVKFNTDELFIDITSGFNIIKRAAGAELGLTKQTLFKRMKDAGVLTRVDDARSRNTIRVTAENHPRQVLCMSLSTVLDLKEVKDDGTPEDTTNEPAGGSEAEPEWADE